MFLYVLIGIIIGMPLGFIVYFGFERLDDWKRDKWIRDFEKRKKREKNKYEHL